MVQSIIRFYVTIITLDVLFKENINELITTITYTYYYIYTLLHVLQSMYIILSTLTNNLKLISILRYINSNFINLKLKNIFC